MCKDTFGIDEIEAGHIDPWRTGDKTNTANCQIVPPVPSPHVAMEAGGYVAVESTNIDRGESWTERSKPRFRWTGATTISGFSGESGRLRNNPVRSGAQRQVYFAL